MNKSNSEQQINKIATVGNFVEIIANTNSHEFEIQQVVVVVDWDEFDAEDAVYGLECAPLEGEEHWFVRHTDYLIVDRPSKYEEMQSAIDQQTERIKELEGALRYADRAARHGIAYDSEYIAGILKGTAKE